MHLEAALCVLGALASCSTEYTYVPVVTSTAVVAGIPAVDYPIPPEAPVGDLRLAVVGVVDVHPAADPTGTVKAIHLRIIAINNGPDTWTLDAQEQRINLSPQVQVRASDVVTDQGARPRTVRVGPGSKETVELFFLLPQALQAEDSRPEFDLFTTVHTPTRTIERRTRFDQQRGETSYEDDTPTNGDWGGSGYEPGGRRTGLGPPD